MDYINICKNKVIKSIVLGTIINEINIGIDVTVTLKFNSLAMINASLS